MFQEIFQDVMVSFNMEMMHHQVRMSHLTYMKNNQHFLVIGEFPQVFSHNFLLVKVSKCPSYINMTSIPNLSRHHNPIFYYY